LAVKEEEPVLDKTAKLNPLFPLGLALLSFALAVYAALTAMMFGFPDSSMTELQRAEEPLYLWFNRLCVAAAFWFLYLLAAAFRNPVRRRFIYSCALYLTLVAAWAVIDAYLQATLDNGIGG
jgi:hypothetical protein